MSAGDPRECRRADGMSKVGYVSKAVAKRAIRRGSAKRSLVAYRCQNCGSIHVGNRTPSRQRMGAA